MMVGDEIAVRGNEETGALALDGSRLVSAFSGFLLPRPGGIRPIEEALKGRSLEGIVLATALFRELVLSSSSPSRVVIAAGLALTRIETTAGATRSTSAEKLGSTG